VIPFVLNDNYENLRLAIDNKLQLELVPYGSPDFNRGQIGQNNVKPFVDDIIKVIGSAPRKFVVFCGKVFPDLLEPFAHTLKKHKFRLLKNDKGQTKSHFEIINIDLQCEGMEPIRACIAPQFPKQGYPVGRYGEKLAELYFDIE
jgi:hypothetical protein